MSNNSISNSFRILTRDFLILQENICPTDDNLRCYSHRIYELFLRAATEFESCCKHGLARIGYQTTKKNKRLDIDDYKNLEPTWQVEKKEVGLLFWQPTVKYIQPFSGWSTNSVVLQWYKSYNLVKHSREKEFSHASFSNLVLALSGLFLSLHAEYGPGFIDPFSQIRLSKGSSSPAHREQFFNNSLFTIRIPAA